MKGKKEEIKIQIQSCIVTKVHFSPLNKPTWCSTILGAFLTQKEESHGRERPTLVSMQTVFKSHTYMGTCSSNI